jgi:hypothetical protein
LLQSAILQQSTDLARKGESVTPKSNALRKGGIQDATEFEFLPLKNPTNEQKQ